MHGAEILVRQAHEHWRRNEQLPYVLLMNLNAAGFDVTDLERQFYEYYEGINS
jgi:hypothetical protein